MDKIGQGVLGEDAGALAMVVNMRGSSYEERQE
jgi:hypothetical protein